MDAEMDCLCYCGASSTLKTGRIFLGCGNYGKGIRGCKFFCWYDPPMNARSKFVIVGFRRRVVTMEKETKERKKFGNFGPCCCVFCGLYFGENILLIVRIELLDVGLSC
ncbi:hypothetical protein GQ457_08G017930 [Hibiscus cannabinus]